MAKLPQLVAALSQVDERPLATIDHIARVAREGGQLPTGKRGSGAAEMGFTEAAKLLIAASVAEAAPKDAALVVPAYWGLPGWNRSAGPIVDDEGLFAEIQGAGTFGEALWRIIESAPAIRESFENYIDAAFCAPDYTDDQRQLLKKTILSGSEVALRVTFRRPSPSATIEFVKFVRGRVVPMYEWAYASADTPRPYAGSSDAVSTRTVGLRTLLALHNSVVGIAPSEFAEATPQR